MLHALKDRIPSEKDLFGLQFIEQNKDDFNASIGKSFAKIKF